MKADSSITAELQMFTISSRSMPGLGGIAAWESRTVQLTES